MSTPLFDPRATDTLFRQEVLSASRERLGAPVRSGRVASWVLTLFFLALLLGVVAVLAFGSYTRRETVEGTLVPTAGALRAASLRHGIVSQVFVQEGDNVLAGAKLFAVSSETSLATLDRRGDPTSLGKLTLEATEREAQATASALDAQRAMNEQRASELEARRLGLMRELDSLSVSLKLQQERERLSEQSFAAAKSLADQELFPAVQLRQREEQLIAAKQGRTNIEREIARATSTLSQMATERRKLEAELTLAAADAERALAQLLERQASNQAASGSIVVAPAAGTVALLQARPGGVADPASVGAIILPPGETLEAELWAPSRAVGFLRPGAAVRLMYDAFPYQKFGVGNGIVRSVARAPTMPADASVAGNRTEALYRIVVTLDRQHVKAHGREWALTPGMRLSADLVLERRSFWEWLISPATSITKRGA